VATGIQEGHVGNAVPQKVSVVKPVARAVGSSYEAAQEEDLPEEPSLLTSRRRGNSDSLPLFDPEGDGGLDVPTFLRRQAD